VQEYVDNMNQALITMNQNCTGKYLAQQQKLGAVTGVIDNADSQDRLDNPASYLNSKQGSVPV
jgi:hypothetical protein